jgi:hypothetical protein
MGFACSAFYSRLSNDILKERVSYLKSSCNSPYAPSARTPQHCLPVLRYLDLTYRSLRQQNTSDPNVQLC